MSEPFPAQIGHTASPKNVKQTMELNPINSPFVHLSRCSLAGFDNCCVRNVVSLRLFALSGCVSLDFTAADVPVRDWTVMSSLASGFVLVSRED